ncbi:cytochrome P450 [Russula vinacea]|nr:cytochrome P450 [Russula vinacea]
MVLSTSESSSSSMWTFGRINALFRWFNEHLISWTSTATINMTSSSPSPFRLLEAFKTSSFRLWLRVLDHGTFSIGVVLSLIVLYAVRYLASPHRNLPPGPRGYPIIGNLFEMIGGGQWLKYAEWHKKYGDLIYLNAAGQPVIIINSQRVAAELLDRRAAIYSDRPHNAVTDIITGGLFFGFSRYGDAWRRMRRAANERFSKTSVMGFYETQMTEAVLLASDFLIGPARWDQHIRRATASGILSVVYGYPTLESEQDHIVVAINDFAERLFKAASIGSHLVHFFPGCDISLADRPKSLAKWKRDAEAWHKQDTAMFEGLFYMAEANVAKGDDHQSVAATLISEVEKNKLSQIERAWFGGTIYAGGSDTTSATMAWWTLAMVAYPETQARAHAELDAIVGRARLPTFADYPRLPYIRAMVKEVLRWRPAGPLGVPHRSTEDDCEDNAPGGSYIKEQGHFSFGFGRRSCVARHMANNSLFINFAVMLWANKLERKKDASGRFLPLDVDGYVDVGLVARPVPFEFEITPRFSETTGMLAQERELRGL